MLNKAGERSEPRKFGIFNHQIWKNSEIRTLFLFWTDLGGGRTSPSPSKLLACGARGLGFDSPPRHLNFQRLVISCFQVEIWLKDR